MSEVASRELRNRTRALLDRVADGECITVTLNGRPVAELAPVAERSRWMSRGRFVRDVLAHQADAGLADDLASLADETTDDLPWH
ncbi:MAG: type II toxin-antitoxin system prevent-host-death family antitoxin [Acidimicrobiaceae bacterium]|nr:type II toxin-antitoxin system prevent-host-death family antitoxin [Acidimicrobiaceae bacterium]MYE75507.1 type II toxin-antitoxin system prevent-host-death family antitoxin [Acidimicrobiaceae bacterium]MYJ42332.1 type II toxin-antitoxin system prevent-host-death family antitoxin [Acidimicrobiaceae bacterium]